jgi:hypothetical protein
MSSQTIAEAFAPAMARYKTKVMESTWGHLAPKKNRSYEGFIIYSIAADGLYCLIDYDFKKLDDSPWFYDALQDFIGDNAKARGKVYRFDGTFCNYVFEGTIREIPCQ